MTSLFDFGDAGGLGEMPVDMIARGGRGVSALEFLVVEDEQRAELADDAECEPGVQEESEAAQRLRQVQAMLEAARSDARDEARREFAAELDRRLDSERERVIQVCSEFAMDRQRYFAGAEAQIVKLAIAIAGKILSREVSADRMHLVATVRAALSRVHEGSESTLRVPVDEQPEWDALFAHSREGKVHVAGDEYLEPGECVLETEVGRVELGVAVQLEEVQRGFDDLLRRQGE